MAEERLAPSRRTGRFGNLKWSGTTVLLVISLDQLGKWLILRYLVSAGTGRVSLGPAWFGLTYVENRGAAFGLLQGHSWLFLAIALMMVGGMALFAVRERGREWFWQLGIGLIIGGAIGNVLDRLRYGFVVDFVAVGPWPKFNLADAAITVGVALFALAVLRADAGPRIGTIDPLETTHG